MFGRVLKAALLLGLGFVGLRMGQPYVQSYQFARVIRDYVESQSVRPHPAQVHRRVVELGQSMGIDLAPDDVSVSPRAGGGFEVRVHYRVPVDLLFYEHISNFEFTSRTGSTSLPGES
jgi:hypothetical protein